MRLGLIINPLAGIGGPAGLKGSDGVAIAHEALARGVVPRASERAREVLQALLPFRERITIHTWGGAMGQELAESLGFETQVLGRPQAGDGADLPPEQRTSALDTENAARALAALPVDLILFAGGDGTARNLVDAIGTRVPVLGIPAGVKIHSGVYAVNPHGAAEILLCLLRGQKVALADTEVRDIDENAFREGRVVARTYGELRVPAEGRYLQNVKCGGKPLEAEALADIAAEISEQIEDDVWYVIGPGTTTRAIMEALGQPDTLLGVDVLHGRECVANDVDEAGLWALLQGKPFRIIVTAIGGQGHVFGRGNQQISPRILRLAGRENICIVATRHKLDELEGRPLRLDTGDAALDRELAGYLPVITGYREQLLYAVSE